MAVTSFPIETKTLAELTTATTLEDTDLIHLDQGGVDKHITGGNLKQVITNYGTNAGKCVDSGVVNAYILSPLSGRQAVSSLQDGMRFYATTSNTNTGASTVAVHGFGALAIVDLEGNTLVGGEITGNFEVEYDLSNTRFFLLANPEVTNITIGSSIATTSGTSIDITNIPSGVKRVTVLFKEVGTNATSSRIVAQLGSGTIETSGYQGAASYVGGTNNAGGVPHSTAFYINGVQNASAVYSGYCTFSKSDGNTWAINSIVSSNTPTDYNHVSSGTKALTGELDRLRLTISAAGPSANEFDSGSINISWEF